MYLEGLKENVATLLSAYRVKAAAVEKLTLELDRNREKLEAAQNKIKELEEKIDSLNLQGAFISPVGDNKAAKARIDSLIKEIDKALVLLQ